MPPRIARAGLRSRIRGWLRLGIAPLHIGQRLYVSGGEFPFTPESLTYQWLRCTGISEGTCSAIAGATNRSYRITNADEGAYLRCTVTAHSGGREQSATSLYVGPVPVTAAGELGAYRYAAPEEATMVIGSNGGSGLKVVISLHGGGWTNVEGGSFPPPVGAGVGTHGESLAECEKNNFVPNVTQFNAFKAAGWLVIGAYYELEAAGNPALPKQVEQIKELIAWVKAHCSAFGGDPTKIVIAGYSAGGHLAMMAAESYNTEHAETAVKRVAGLSGITNLKQLAKALQNFETEPGQKNLEYTAPDTSREQWPEMTTSKSQLSTAVGRAVGMPGSPNRETIYTKIQEAPYAATADLYSPAQHVDSHCPLMRLYGGSHFEYVPVTQQEEQLAALAAKGSYKLVPIAKTKSAFLNNGHATGYWSLPVEEGKATTVAEDVLAYLGAV